MIEPPQHNPSRVSPIKPAIVLGVGVAMAAAVLLHVPGLDGASYHKWFYRRISFGVYPLMALAAMPFFVGQWLRMRGKTWAAIGAIMAATVAMQIAAMPPQPLGIGRIPAIVDSGVNTSYYSGAKVFVEQQETSGTSIGECIGLYPQLLDYFPLHARYKPGASAVLRAADQVHRRGQGLPVDRRDDRRGAGGVQRAGDVFSHPADRRRRGRGVRRR